MFDLNFVNTSCNIPNTEPQRQLYFMACCKKMLEDKKLQLGRPLKMFVRTFGCQMNEHDSEKLSGMLLAMGYDRASGVDDADFIIFNTCAIRENAELKVYGHLGALKALKSRNNNLIIAICGCMMQQDTVVQHIRKTYPHVDIIFGTHNLFKLPELLSDALDHRSCVTEILNTTNDVVEEIAIDRADTKRAYINIIYGCNNFCSYCIVPFVRGRERSRKLIDIINEVKELAKRGYIEITLLGQNVNSYGNDLDDPCATFPNLLRELNKIDGIQRIRFMTPHPKDFSNELILAIRDLDKVCHHIHLPLQSGSTKVLADMNRHYTKEQYLSLVENIRKNIPDITITTDIIVGFPGETEENFLDTIDVVEKACFDMAYTFIYSKRTGTKAALSPKQIPEDVTKDRFDRLLEVQNKCSIRNNNHLLNCVLDVFVEGFSKTSHDKLTGRTSGNKVVNFLGNESLIGNIVPVKIVGSKTWSLEGQLMQ